MDGNNVNIQHLINVKKACNKIIQELLLIYSEDPSDLRQIQFLSDTLEFLFDYIFQNIN